MDLICGSLDLFSIAILGVLLLGTALKTEQPKPFGKKIILLLLGHMIGLLCDSAIWFWNPERFPSIDISVAIVTQKLLLLIAYIVLVGMTIVYTKCLIQYIEEKKPVSKRIMPCVTAVCIVAIVLWVVAIFNGMYFTFDENGMFVVAKYYWVSQGIIGALLCADLFLILKHHKTMGWRNAVPLLVYILLPIIGFSLSYRWDVTPVYIAATLSMLLMFIVFHLEQDKQLRKQEQLLTQSRISIMLTQIQPHFIYNTLTAICGLCDENPAEAKKVTSEFADYLRHNLESLTQSTPVLFEEELQHTKVYLNIEKKRFEEKLHIVYDIETVDFRIPALTIQPLVENAVKHGITKRKDGGTVQISTREGPDCYEIIIADDGVGFEVGAAHTNPDAHIGMNNVRYRLWSICHSTLDIASKVGVGTAAKITIPKET